MRTGPIAPPGGSADTGPAVSYRAYTLAQRPGLLAHFQRLHRVAWPAFLHDDPVNALWPRLYRDFADYQIALRDESGRVAAVGNAIPIVWNGTPRGLPDRIVDVIANGIRALERGRRPTALSALAAIVEPRHRARGLSERVVTAMAGVAVAHGLGALVAPVRPSLKGRYPLTPMTRYVTWKRPDGSPFDPWLRVHWRLGARILRITPRGNTVRATVAQWEDRTGWRFPASGRYVVPDAFRPILVDRERGVVRYEEENVWMLHPVGAQGRSRGGEQAARGGPRADGASRPARG